MLAYDALALPFKMKEPKTETTVNLKSASFVVIVLLHKVLTHIQSQIKPWLPFGESFALTHGKKFFWAPVHHLMISFHSLATVNFFKR